MEGNNETVNMGSGNMDQEVNGPGDQLMNNGSDNIPQNRNQFSNEDMNNPGYSFNFENSDNFENMTPLQVAPWISDFNTCNTIENLNTTSNFELNQDIQKIIDIHQDMVGLLSDRFTVELDKEKEEELVEHKKIIENGMKSIELLSDRFQEQQKKTLLAEKKFKEVLSETSDDANKIKDFTTFMIQMDSKYKDPEIKSLNKTMIDISDKIKKNSKCEELKQDYQKQTYLMKYYLHHFIKKLNGANLGSTCSLCLQRQVDTFMNPCGHTGCSECIQMLKESGGNEYTTNCFMCRKVVIKFQKIYFT